MQEIVQNKKMWLQSLYRGNEYLCAYNVVKEYVRDDKNKLLKLKAECRKESFGEFLALIVAVLALYISGIQCLISVFDVGNIMWLKIAAVVVLMILAICTICLVEQFKCVSKWRSYVDVAIEEVEEEFADGSK